MTGRSPSGTSTWRESHATPIEVLPGVLADLADDFRARTAALFGLPDGEHVDLDLVTDKPWSGFNHYLGGLRSRVEINVDLPVLSLSLGHLVAHEAYPGHHTEHVRKEVGLVRRRQWWEESIFLVGTPQCLLAEGLADLGIEVLLGDRPEPVLAEHLRAHGLPYDAEVVAAVAGGHREPGLGPLERRHPAARGRPLGGRRHRVPDPMVPAARGPGPRRPSPSSPIPRGGPTSAAMSRVSRSAGRSSAATRPATTAS